jgi:hypothetical protein
MVARGAEGTDEDVQKAVDYLAKYFGKPPAPKDAANLPRFCRHLVD